MTEACALCQGAGGYWTGEWQPCPGCKGSGSERVRQENAATNPAHTPDPTAPVEPAELDPAMVEREAVFRVSLPARLFDDERVAAIFEDAIERIEALEPDRKWDVMLSGSLVPQEPDAPALAAALARATSAEQERDRLRERVQAIRMAWHDEDPETWDVHTTGVSAARAARHAILDDLDKALAGSGEQPGEDCENHGERANDGQAFCCGCGTCQATEHIHGCFADNGACEYPDDHHPAPVVPDSTDVRERVER